MLPGLLWTKVFLLFIGEIPEANGALFDKVHYTQQNILDSRWTANGRPMFGQQKDINLPRRLKHQSTICCPMYGTFFHMIIACILIKCYFLDFHQIFFSFLFWYIGQPFVNKRTANGQMKYMSTVYAQMDSKLTKIFVNRLCTNVGLMINAQMFQCTKIVHRNIRWIMFLLRVWQVHKRIANGRLRYSSTVWHQ